jgi:hypothetical protein
MSADFSSTGAAAAAPTATDAGGSSGKALAASLTIGELEAGYSLYCKALRLLIQEGRSLTRIQRTVCWQRLSQLHACLPGQYKDPEHLYFQLRRSLAGSGA